MRLHIGIDDTDSPKGGCTTYIGALLIENLVRRGLRFLDYPNLIRLNPNVPWKTRGNGAICLRVEGEGDQIARSIEESISAVEENGDLDHEKTHPGLVFLLGDITAVLKSFSKRVIRGIVRKTDAIRLVKKLEAEAVGFKKGRGIIGALAAIGEELNDSDYTYELIAYRTPENRGLPRKISIDSVLAMDKLTRPNTFNNIDYETRRVLITPHGPDPILYGIRGETPETVREAGEIVEAHEPIERWLIYRTNQGTDAHFSRPRKACEAKPYNPVVLIGEVASAPKVIKGGHVFFELKDETGEIECAAYEPTGRLREVVRNLTVGDMVEIFGGVRPSEPTHPITVNIEKLRVARLAEKFTVRNPPCPRCGKRMKSAGKTKGLRCMRCGFRSSTLRRVLSKEERGLAPGLYVPSPRAQRHLTKPHSRYGMEKEIPPISLAEPWHMP